LGEVGGRAVAFRWEGHTAHSETVRHIKFLTDTLMAKKYTDM
jgi:hypothetical protein